MESFAEASPPGEFLLEELTERSWSHADLARLIGLRTRLVDEVITGKAAVTIDIALRLGDALGTGPEVWMNLERQHQLSRAGREGKSRS